MGINCIIPHASLLFAFFLILITQGNLRFFSLSDKRGWCWRRYCILAPPDICLSSKTIKYVLIVMRGFSILSFLSYFLWICIKNFASHERETFFFVLFLAKKCAQTKKNERIQLQYFSYLFFYFLFMWLLSFEIQDIEMFKE